MSEALVLVGDDAPGDPIAWARVEADTGAILEQGLAEAGAAIPAGAPSRTVLVLPGADAQVKRLDLPARTDVQARAGAPFLFEGALAAASDVHYAVGEAQDEAGARLVAAISGARLSAWLDRARAHGADPHHVYLDFTIWPAAPGEVEIALTPTRAIVAAGAHGGFAIEPALAPGLFTRWLAHAPVAISLVRVAGTGAEEWAQRLGAAGQPARAGAASDPVETLARAAVSAPDYAPNLRQGAFAPAARTASPWRIWSFAAALAVLALLLQVVSLVIDGVSDQRAAAQLLARAEADFRAARPDVRRIVNLRAQVGALVSAMEKSGTHPVLAASDPLILTLQANALVRLDEVRHQGPGRRVEVRLSAREAAPLEAAAADLRAQGLQVEARALQPEGGRYVAQLVLESP